MCRCCSTETITHRLLVYQAYRPPPSAPLALSVRPPAVAHDWYDLCRRFLSLLPREGGSTEKPRNLGGNRFNVPSNGYQPPSPSAALASLAAESSRAPFRTDVSRTYIARVCRVDLLTNRPLFNGGPRSRRGPKPLPHLFTRVKERERTPLAKRERERQSVPRGFDSGLYPAGRSFTIDHQMRTCGRRAMCRIASSPWTPLPRGCIRRKRRRNVVRTGEGVSKNVVRFSCFFSVERTAGERASNGKERLHPCSGVPSLVSQLAGPFRRGNDDDDAILHVRHARVSSCHPLSYPRTSVVASSFARRNSVSVFVAVPSARHSSITLFLSPSRTVLSSIPLSSSHESACFRIADAAIVARPECTAARPVPSTGVARPAGGGLSVVVTGRRRRASPTAARRHGRPLRVNGGCRWRDSHDATAATADADAATAGAAAAAAAAAMPPPTDRSEIIGLIVAADDRAPLVVLPGALRLDRTTSTVYFADPSTPRSPCLATRAARNHTGHGHVRLNTDRSQTVRTVPLPLLPSGSTLGDMSFHYSATVRFFRSKTRPTDSLITGLFGWFLPWR